MIAYNLITRSIFKQAKDNNNTLIASLTHKIFLN